MRKILSTLGLLSLWVLVGCTPGENAVTDEDMLVSMIAEDVVSRSVPQIDMDLQMSENGIIAFEDKISATPEEFEEILRQPVSTVVEFQDNNVVQYNNGSCVERLMIKVIFKLSNGIVVPIEFSYNVISPIVDGDINTPYQGLRFELNSRCLGGVDDENYSEPYSLSYYALDIRVYNIGEYIGTIVARISIYTANIPVVFDATIEDWTGLIEKKTAVIGGFFCLSILR